MKKQNLFVLGFVILSIGALILISGCIEEKPRKKTTIETTTIEQPSELTLKIGETATTDKIEITVISAKKERFYRYWYDALNQYLTQVAPQGYVYLIVEVEIKNVGADSVYVSNTNFNAIDSNGYRYDVDMLYMSEDRLETFQELYKNQKVRGKLLFKVPKDAKGLKIQYDFGSLLTGVKLATWELE